jgi:hypothetical protein
MRFMVMHKVDAKMESGAAPDQRIIQGMGEFIGKQLKAGVFQDGAGLHPSRQRVRLTFAGGRRTIVRGPYAGGNELLASFAMIQATSQDHAVEIATRLAGALGDVEIEIGPVVEAWDLGLIARPADASQRFLVLRKADRAYEAGAAAPAPLAELLDELRAEGVLLAGATLAPSSSGARSRKVAGQRAWTDGPFTESKELVAGFSIIEVAALGDAKRWAEAYADILGDNEVDIRAVV